MASAKLEYGVIGLGRMGGNLARQARIGKAPLLLMEEGSDQATRQGDTTTLR